MMLMMFTMRVYPLLLSLFFCIFKRFSVLNDRSRLRALKDYNLLTEQNRDGKTAASTIMRRG